MNEQTTQPTNETQPDFNSDTAPHAEMTIAGLRAEIGELQSAIRDRAARDTMLDLFTEAGVRSPELLFQAAKDRLQFDADGIPANGAALVAEMKRQFPEQFAAGGPQHNSIDAGTGVSSVRSLTREALAKMSPEQIAKLDWSAVRDVLSHPGR
ncbi:MAG: hypothetical protein ACR2IH_06355 [Pyrinomonadaceae bacterium]